MEGEYWRYNNNNNDPRHPPPSSVSSLPPKRPRSDYEAPSGGGMSGYYSRDDDGASHHAVKDTESINASYDRYLRNGQPPYAGPDSSRLPGSGMPGHPGYDPRMVSDPFISSDSQPGSDPRIATIGAMDPAMSMNGRGSVRPDVSVPRDATNTIFVEGLPGNCTRREVAHIFRPFVGYKEVRLVTKESRRRGGDPFVLCFVDFVSPGHAAAALDVLQGYKFDENDRDSASLRLQYARNPGTRSGGGFGIRGRR